MRSGAEGSSRLTWHWSYKSLPELAGLQDDEKRRVWGRCVERVARRPSAGVWAAVALMFASALSLSALSDPAVSGAGFRLPVPVFWGVAAATALLFNRAMFAAARRHIPAELPGYCRGCGYDLTGNASGACPECGRAAAA